MSRIIQISDTHIVAPGQLANGVVDTAKALAAALDTISRHRDALGKIDLVIFTGDLTDHGDDAEYAEFLRLIDGLDIPFVAVPGNHDNRDAMRRAFGGAAWMPKSGQINARVDLKDATVLAIDSLVTDAPHGELTEATLKWLSDQIAELSGRPVLVALHHPPIPTGLALMDAQGLLNASDLENVLRRCAGPCCVIAGHAHRMISGSFAGHNVIVCPGTSHAVALDLRPEKNDRFVMEPSGVVIHDVTSRHRAHLLPSGTFEGPFPFQG